LSARACAVLDAGELWARGENISGGTGKTLTMLWLGAGAAGRFEVAILPALSLEAEAHLLALYRHDKFVFEPNEVSVHAVSPLSVGANLGLVLRLP
jgi:hypothetical protein